MKHTEITHQDVFRTIQQAGKDISETTDWAHVQGSDDLLTDLGFDSLTMMLFAIRIEDVFGVSIPNAAQFRTVDDICAYIEKNLPQSANSK